MSYNIFTIIAFVDCKLIMARHDRYYYGNDSNQKVAKRIPTKQLLVHGYKERQKYPPTISCY